MTIIKAFPENIDNLSLFYLTQGQSTKLLDAAGETLELQAWVLYDKEDNSGVVKRVLTVLTNDGVVYGTISETFLKTFENAAEFFDENDQYITKIKVTKGVSKNSREFIDMIPVEVKNRA